MLDSIPPRLGNVEQEIHTLKHQVKRMEDERLPHRVVTLEGNVGYLMEVAQDAKATRDAVNGLTSYVKGMAKVLTILFAVLTLVIAAVGLIPKFDAVVVEKSPTKATIKE